MKHLKLFFPVISLVFLFSCSEDETISFDEEKFAGNWRLTALNYEGETSTSYSGTKVTIDYTGEGFDMDVDVVFTNNPNEMTSTGDYSILLKVTSLGQTTTQEWTNENFVESGTWTLNGDEMKITSQGTEQTVKILSLDDTTLKMSQHTTETTSQSGVTVTYDVLILYTFERQ